MTFDRSDTPLGAVWGLLSSAHDLLDSPTENEERKQLVVHWLADYALFAESLRGMRYALRTEVFTALGMASACWDNLNGAGEFRSHEAAQIGDDLMRSIDQYVDLLPLVRQRTSFPDNSPTEFLARAIYEASIYVEREREPDWASLTDEMKLVLRNTAEHLIEQGITFPAESDTHVPSTQEEPVAQVGGLPPNIPMPPGFQSDTTVDVIYDEPGSV